MHSRYQPAIALLIALLLAPAASLAGSNLVINEIDYDQPSTDGAEFIELKNLAAGGINLDFFKLLLINGSNGLVYAEIQLEGLLLPGDYYVICGNAANVANCDLDVDPDTNLVQNGAPDAVAIEFVGTSAGPNIVEAVSYEGSVPGFVEGSGEGLEDDPTFDTSSIGRFPDGVDTGQNNVDLSFQCATPGEANVGAPCAVPVRPASWGTLKNVYR